jgi:hypothetical protein
MQSEETIALFVSGIIDNLKDLELKLLEDILFTFLSHQPLKFDTWVSFFEMSYRYGFSRIQTVFETLLLDASRGFGPIETFYACCVGDYKLVEAKTMSYLASLSDIQLTHLASRNKKIDYNWILCLSEKLSDFRENM